MESSNRHREGCSQVAARVISFTSLFLTLGCGAQGDDQIETVSSSLTNASMKTMVPAYYQETDSTSSWDRLISGSTSGWAIANVFNGPGTTAEAWLTARMDQLNSAGKVVLGYVPLNGGDRPIKDITSDILMWKGLYGSRIHGVFFDEAARQDSTRIPIFENLVWYTQVFYGSTAPVVFNPGTAFVERKYFDCTAQQARSSGNVLNTRFVTQEYDETNYLSSANDSNWADPTWNWVNGYSPEHFVHLVHDAAAGGDNVNSVLTKARNRNAHAVFITDRPSSNPWDQLAAPALWDAQNSAIATLNANPPQFPGVAAQSETLTQTCPAKSFNADGNLAFQKPTMQKSTAFGGDSSFAVDGNWDGNFYDNSVTHTNLEYFPWWQVDLQSSQFISFIEIFNRTDCCAGRLGAIAVMTSDDMVNWNSISLYANQMGQKTRVDINASARYVKIMLQAQGYLSLAEVHVFGSGNDVW